MVGMPAVKTIDQIQHEIIDEFSVLGEDRETTLFYIMELGQQLPPMEESCKTDDNIIRGCQSKVWLTTAVEDGDRIIYRADSNTDITKGLIAMLIRVLSGQHARDIAAADLFFIERIGMGRIIGAQRSNGLSSMIKQMKLYALAYHTKFSS